MSLDYNFNKTISEYKSIIKKFNEAKEKFHIKKKNLKNKNNINDLINKFKNINLNEKIEENKYKIIKLFNKNVKGKKINKNNLSHDGEIGHKLEKLMNIK